MNGIGSVSATKRFSSKTGRDYEDAENLASLGIQMVKTKAKRFFYRRYVGFNTLTVEVE